MEAIKKIVTVRDNVLRIVLPDSYNDKQVELIILPTDRGKAARVEEGKTDYYSKYYGTMKSSLSAKEVDKKLKDFRDEWNRDTF